MPRRAPWSPPALGTAQNTEATNRSLGKVERAKGEQTADQRASDPPTGGAAGGVRLAGHPSDPAGHESISQPAGRDTPKGNSEENWAASRCRSATATAA